MKTIHLMLIFAITAGFAFGNEIDALKTNQEVNNFLAQNVLRKDSEVVVLNGDKSNPLKYGKNKFYKLDLDNNGLTDLVVDGKYLFAVMDNGSKKYGIHSIDRGAFSLDKYTLTKIIYDDKKPILVVRSYTTSVRDQNSENGEIGGIKTEKMLIFKFDGFVEYNTKQNNLKIKNIKFSTSGCYGSCSIFELTIESDKTAIYNAIKYNDSTGKFKAIIDTNSYDKIIQTINYINLLKLNNKYNVRWTDDQTSTLEIKYNNGKIKKISDYGMIGTFGLENLYEQLFILRETQKWMK